MDEDDGIRRWARLIHERGHAGTFARRTASEKEVVERATAAEWARSVEASFRLPVTELERPPRDPPDLRAKVEGRTVSIELVELVDAGLLRDLSRARKAGSPMPYPEQFARSQWSSARLNMELNRILDKKQSKYAGKVPIDYLVVHSAEPWLPASEVGTWLSEQPIARRPVFRSAHLLLSYDPTYAAHWPVFELY